MRVILNGVDHTNCLKTRRCPIWGHEEFKFSFGLNPGMYTVEWYWNDWTTAQLFFSVTSLSLGRWLTAPIPGDDPEWRQFLDDSNARPHYYMRDFLGFPLVLYSTSTDWWCQYLGESWIVGQGPLLGAKKHVMEQALQKVFTLSERALAYKPVPSLPVRSRFDLIG